MAEKLTADDLEKIQQKIETGKQTKARAEGALKNLMDSLKREYGVETLEAAKEKLAELQSSLEEAESRRDKFLEKLSTVTDWNKV